MFIEIDFNSDEALYMQLRNQIILGIATSKLKEGESLPSVRSLADAIGINMHTVNKAYATLKQDGFVRVDRRRGVVVAVDLNKLQNIEIMKGYLRPIAAAAMAKGISREEAMKTMADVYDELF
ncbi:MAG: GntR family transcriptional regulator [Lachnospiraceae bacterium]|nr:GntR family transcriptional regulator [Lachnospiraceae bacterium]